MSNVVKFTQDQDTRDLMSEAKFYEGYARWNDKKNRYETWEEAIDRVMGMHRDFYKDKINDNLDEYINEATASYKQKYVLGAQRALQFGGEQLIKHQMRLYNCFSRDTRFITSLGVKSFEDFDDGDEIEVLTHKGNWKKALVKKYGNSLINEITFKKNGFEKKVKATPDHRWILKDGETTNLSVGDKIAHAPDYAYDFEWDTASFEEQLYWCYGYIFGDGTVNKNGYSKVRLCGKDIGYEHRFLSMGFKSSSSLSINGDIIISSGKYQKTMPNPAIDSPNLIRAFVRGYLDADGEPAESRFDYPRFVSIQCSDSNRWDFIKDVFPIGGYYILGNRYFEGNGNGCYPNAKPSKRFRISSNTDSKFNPGWTVKEIKEYAIEEVWCLEVEDDKSFVLEHGLVTGNCTSTYADRVNYFGEYFYVLLCGAGMGVSIQKHHVAKLPKIQNRTKQAKIYNVEDSIEGWAHAADVLMSSYFVGGGVHPEYEGRRVYFDTTAIRPKGAMISGGFKAPGPEPLRKALDKIEHLLQGLVLKGVSELSPINVYDISMHLADAVLSGGVRRSATIFLFSLDDTEMMNAKTGNWFAENPQRARSNNSAVIVRSEAKREDFSAIMESLKHYGEPGFIFVEDTEFTYNPCVSGDAIINVKDHDITQNGEVISKGVQYTLRMDDLVALVKENFVQGGNSKTIPLVLSKNLDSGELEYKEILWGDKTKTASEVIEIETACGKKVTVTPDHQIWTKNRGWIKAEDLAETDELDII